VAIATQLLLLLLLVQALTMVLLYAAPAAACPNQTAWSAVSGQSGPGTKPDLLTAAASWHHAPPRVCLQPLLLPAVLLGAAVR
jgi:uncharacterized protein YraI